MKNTLNMVIRYTAVALFSLVFGLTCYYFNAVNVVNNPLPMPFGYGVTIVTSDSMKPTLEKNDLVIVKASDEFQLGDIAVYAKRGKLTIHRIVEDNGNTYLLKGDANNTEDSIVQREQLLAVRKYTIRGGGKVINFFRSPVGILIYSAMTFLIIRLTGNPNNFVVRAVNEMRLRKHRKPDVQ